MVAFHYSCLCQPLPGSSHNSASHSYSYWRHALSCNLSPGIMAPSAKPCCHIVTSKTSRSLDVVDDCCLNRIKSCSRAAGRERVARAVLLYMWLCRRESPSSLDNTYGNRDRTACHSNWLVYRYWLAQSCANDRFHPRNHYYYKSCNVVDHNELGIRHSTERDSPFSRNDRTATYCAGSA